jgi:hypothetical protein
MMRGGVVISAGNGRGDVGCAPRFLRHLEQLEVKSAELRRHARYAFNGGFNKELGFQKALRDAGRSGSWACG